MKNGYIGIVPNKSKNFERLQVGGRMSGNNCKWNPDRFQLQLVRSSVVSWPLKSICFSPLTLPASQWRGWSWGTQTPKGKGWIDRAATKMGVPPLFCQVRGGAHSQWGAGMARLGLSGALCILGVRKPWLAFTFRPLNYSHNSPWCHQESKAIQWRVLAIIVTPSWVLGTCQL